MNRCLSTRLCVAEGLCRCSFFFQAEDGIRDRIVTGVQTCALPICATAGQVGTDSTGTHYTFAHLNQKTVSLTGRVDYTLSTVLTLQLYAQPFVSKGTYSNVRELADPNAAAFDNRYKPYAATPGGFNDKEVKSPLLLRWE